MSKDRYLAASIQEDLESKIVLLSGPRQVGKTFLSRGLNFSKTQYLNFDSEEDRKLLKEKAWIRQDGLLILDELHKMKNWKRWLKGIYDTEGLKPRLLVTGSARLDTFRRGGESLAGRHFHLRLHPFSVKEVGGNAHQTLLALLKFGGFPEPFLRASDTFAKRWRRTHIDRILREDLLDLQPIRDLKSIEILERLVSERISSTLSFSSLAEDLQVSPHTVKNWLETLENLYVLFKISPYSKNIAKSLKKEPKYYLFDTGRVTASEGGRFENLIAVHLLKRCHYLEDVLGENVALHYLRDKEKREVDFITLRNGKPEWLIEVKLSDDSLSPALRYYGDRLKPERIIQVVLNLKRQKHVEGKYEIIPAAQFLSGLEV